MTNKTYKIVRPLVWIGVVAFSLLVWAFVLRML